MDGSDPPAGAQASAERKLVTVLVCEVGEPIAAAGQRDLGDRDRLLAGALTGVQAEVAPLQGAGGRGPRGCGGGAWVLEVGCHAAYSYSWISPPRTTRRRS